ncbi:NTP transferase domain-containing protein [Halolamina sp.]|jgi:molybdenum cofactor cytidylyltransferase|uniref:nucleotidyltransferase family protein n=1 Tax=Halolamina sp. TaxID=1940283 RepID=UPI003566A0B8
MEDTLHDGTVVGVLLAAGLGTRFAGGNKLLAHPAAEERSQPIVRLSAERLVEAPVDRAVVVLGNEAEQVADALTPVDIETVYNPEYETGQATSVAHGVDWARDQGADAALFALGDMPWVSPATYQAIVDRWRETGAGIVVPEYDGQRGNPVLFGATHFDGLAAVTGDTGGRELMAREPVERVAVDDPGISRDVDHRDDLQA